MCVCAGEGGEGGWLRVGGGGMDKRKIFLYTSCV